MSNPNQPSTATKAAMGVFRVAEAVVKQAVKTPQQQQQQQQQQPIVTQGVVVGTVEPPQQQNYHSQSQQVPVVYAQPTSQQPLYGENNYHQQQVYATQQTTGYVVQQQQQQQATVIAFQTNNLPPARSSLIGVTLGFEQGVGAAFREASLQQCASISDDDVNYFSKRFSAALRTRLFCCCLAIEVILERILAAFFNIIVMLFGNMIGTLILTPETIFCYYRSVVCICPRMTCEYKILGALLFPLLAIIGVFSVAILSVFHATSSMFVPCPRPFLIGFNAVGMYFTKGREWRLKTIKDFENPEGPRYTLHLLTCILLPIMPLIGMIFGAGAFIFIAIMESPRIWYNLTFKTLSSRNCCYGCYVCLMIFVSLFYVLGLILFAPFAGLFSGASVGCQSVLNNPTTFFDDQISNAKRFLNGLPFTGPSTMNQ